jgi:hypothetical protein
VKKGIVIFHNSIKPEKIKEGYKIFVVLLKIKMKYKIRNWSMKTLDSASLMGVLHLIAILEQTLLVKGAHISKMNHCFHTCLRILHTGGPFLISLPAEILCQKESSFFKILSCIVTYLLGLVQKPRDARSVHTLTIYKHTLGYSPRKSHSRVT